ncbi:DUF1731 domain-containing protein [Streptomyces sp. NPDC049541]|uniref:DUF1731 domain-containing protein n=1 Tax=Streptomyces sp. NPDC049541 TaxID=3365594 RepID=UPI0037915854
MTSKEPSRPRSRSRRTQTPRSHEPRAAPTDAVPALRTVLGELPRDMLDSARVLPKRLLESGFTFAFPDIEGAPKTALAEP